jgi:hypothetical protein
LPVQRNATKKKRKRKRKGPSHGNAKKKVAHKKKKCNKKLGFRVN